MVSGRYNNLFGNKNKLYSKKTKWLYGKKKKSLY